MKRRSWKEKGVQLSGATVTLFEGPGPDYLLVVHGRKTTSKKVTRKPARGGRRSATPPSAS